MFNDLEDTTSKEIKMDLLLKEAWEDSRKIHLLEDLPGKQHLCSWWAVDS